MSISLLLQQAIVDKNDVLFACVCESAKVGEPGIMESGYFTEGLTEWFHREGILLFGKERKNKEPEKSLLREIVRLEDENTDYLEKKRMEPGLQYWGILMCEQRGWIFCRGECKGYLINKRFQKKQIQEILDTKKREDFIWQEVKIQRHLGILISTGDFLKEMEKEELSEVLAPDTNMTEARMQKRLKEIWKEQKCRSGANSVGAIYLRT